MACAAIGRKTLRRTHSRPDNCNTKVIVKGNNTIDIIPYGIISMIIQNRKVRMCVLCVYAVGAVERYN